MHSMHMHANAQAQEGGLCKLKIPPLIWNHRAQACFVLCAVCRVCGCVGSAARSGPAGQVPLQRALILVVSSKPPRIAQREFEFGVCFIYMRMLVHNGYWALNNNNGQWQMKWPWCHTGVTSAAKKNRAAIRIVIVMGGLQHKDDARYWPPAPNATGT
jgi:hypothetical protein